MAVYSAGSVRRPPQLGHRYRLSSVLAPSTTRLVDDAAIGGFNFNEATVVRKRVAAFKGGVGVLNVGRGTRPRKSGGPPQRCVSTRRC